MFPERSSAKSSVAKRKLSNQDVEVNSQGTSTGATYTIAALRYFKYVSILVLLVVFLMKLWDSYEKLQVNFASAIFICATNRA